MLWYGGLTMCYLLTTAFSAGIIYFKESDLAERMKREGYKKTNKWKNMKTTRKAIEIIKNLFVMTCPIGNIMIAVAYLASDTGELYETMGKRAIKEGFYEPIDKAHTNSTPEECQNTINSLKKNIEELESKKRILLNIKQNATSDVNSLNQAVQANGANICGKQLTKKNI